MHTNQSYQNYSVPQYVEALLQCEEKKVCTNLGKTLNLSHDKVYNDFKKAAESNECEIESLKTIAERELDPDNILLVHDDTQLSKIYAKNIEGLAVGYDGSTHKPCLGLKMMTSLLTDMRVNIPINAIPYIDKELAQSSYKTKSELAIDITRDVIRHFKIKRMLADAHFATKEMLSFLLDEKLNFLMKILRRRIVTIKGSSGQLQNVLRLKKNNHTGVAKGAIDGLDCYFYVIKLSNEATIYLVSNDYIDPRKVIELYKIRWNIEVFHRTAKQYLGLKDCQMIVLEKQRQHALYVMHAYAIASVKTALMGLECVEDYLKHHRLVKKKQHVMSQVATERSFGYAA